jgi:phosphoglycerate dehydrogenase-like enzyme
MTPLTIWCNAHFPPDAQHILEQGVKPHRLVLSHSLETSNLAPPTGDEQCRRADVAIGQPSIEDVIASTTLNWIHLTSAGYTRYDREDLRAALRSRGGALTNSSHVYDDPCAQHVLSFMLAHARQLVPAVASQREQVWNYAPLRAAARVLSSDQTVLIVGYGAIARRLTALLAPFAINLIGLRRTPRGDEPIRVEPMSQLDALLPQADHVVNLLPSGKENARLFNASRFARMKPTAAFYNVGRGDTVDQDALVSALQQDHLGAAYVDVTTPEPLPPENPLWAAPRCLITPHIAGGRQNEMEHLVRHFLSNLQRYTRGEGLIDRIV